MASATAEAVATILCLGLLRSLEPAHWSVARPHLQLRELLGELPREQVAPSAAVHNPAIVQERVRWLLRKGTAVQRDQITLAVDCMRSVEV
jgi:hypothetical protein